MLAAGHRNRAELRARRAVLVHVPARRQPVALGRADHAVGPLEILDPVGQSASPAGTMSIAIDAQHGGAEPRLERRHGIEDHEGR